MQRYHSIRLLAMACVLSVSCESAVAQQGLFGQRSLGRSLSRRAGPQASAATGIVDQNRRFLRDQRSPTEFVGGGPGGGGAAGFVGGQSAVTSAVSSVVGLREEIRVPVNRPRIARSTGLYPERLSIETAPVTGQNDTSGAVISNSLAAIMADRQVTIEVSQADRSATLRGAVPSEEDRRTTELLVMLEPGIQTIVNELTVDPTLTPFPVRRPRVPRDGLNPGDR